MYQTIIVGYIHDGSQRATSQKVQYYNLSHMDECSMGFIGRDELISSKASGLWGYELVEPDLPNK